MAELRAIAEKRNTAGSKSATWLRLFPYGALGVSGPETSLSEVVQPPWMESAMEMSRHSALQELMELNPLHCHLGDISAEGFYAFMVERELIRIRREQYNWPQEWWSTHEVMRKLHLTNVKRVDDYTTRVILEMLSPALLRMLEHDSVPSTELLRWTALAIFNIALWRTFGTERGIRSVGFVQEWDIVTKDALCQRLCEAGVLCFS